ncbi:uncharacterized protein C8A04DRAFT_14408 [Dichotomopilus funicola]|uniref:Oxidoreductase AflY n=1 Tax=Dichotomopilus funicola TaxID=1934379 RepID=A0AAN6UXJ6_9PEZI|nr:hypothetical protein C8A04DRAFT_14408 [Dichotomopilus funicola]
MSAAPIQLSSSHLGLVNAHNQNVPPGTLEECNRLLQQNHETFHMFFRDTAGHNHIVHSLLTVLALGGTPQDLRDRYDDGVPIQRPLPAINTALLSTLFTTDTNTDTDTVLLESLGSVAHYPTFLAFFQHQIASSNNNWKAVVQRYLFARTPLADALLARMFEGAYHPLIHLGLGIEFAQPALIAEALAQAAAHDDSHIGTLFRHAEAEAGIAYPSNRGKGKAMMELLREVRETEAIRTAPRWTDFGNKMRDGIVGRAGEAMASVAAQFQIRIQDDGDAELARRTAEMLNVCAFMAGAAQRAGRPPKIDFFYMHAVTSSLFVDVIAQQTDWISLADRARVVEWKARLDLAWYAVCGSAALDGEFIEGYSHPESDGLGWDELFAAVVQEHDDGHAAKFLRALKNGEDRCKRYAELEQWAGDFPMKGDMWLRLARMCHDTTKGRPTDLKWIPFTGFEQPWARPDLAK